MRSIRARVSLPNTGRRWLTKSAIASLLIIGSNTQAAPQTWQTTGFTDGNWNFANNWVGNAVPGASSGSANGDTATFNGGANTSVTIDLNRNIQNILFDTASAGAFTFSGGPLTVTNGGSITVNAAVTNTQTFNNNFLGSPNSGATAYSFLNNSSTPGAKLDIAGNITGQMTASTETFTFGGTNGGTVSGVISNGAGAGTVSVTKSGVGTWNLTNANTYTGTTTISGGTLALNGGNNRLATAGTVNFSGVGTLDVGSTEQTLANMTAGNNITGTVNGSGGKLTLTGSLFSLGATAQNQTQTLNMSGLSTFEYNNPTGTFRVSGTLNTAGQNGGAGVLTLANGANTITALAFGLGNINNSNNSGVNTGTANMGTLNTINANTITIGGNRGAGALQYSIGTNTPTLNLFGTDGTSRVGSMILSDQGGPSTTGTVLGLVDLTSNVTGASTLNAMITTLVIGKNNRGANAGGNAIVNTGTFTMGAGTLDATTIYIAQNTAGYTNGGTSTTTGNLTVTGGMIKVNNFYFADQNTSGAGASALVANFNLNGGANLYAANIAKGTGAGTFTTTRNFNWNDGTIRNYDSSTDLEINTGLTLKLAATGTHSFNIDSNRTGTIDAILADATTGGTVVKDGAGKLVLTAANTFSGLATVLNGMLLANNTTGSAFGTANVVVNGGTLGGTGSFTGAVNVGNGSGTADAFLAPGASIGTLTALGLLTLNSDSVFQVEINTLTALADQMNSLGVTIDPASSITLTDIGFTPTALPLGTSFTLLNNTSGLAINGVFANLPNGGTIGDGTNFYTANYAGGTGGNDLVLTVTAIPEPGTLITLALGGIGLCLLRRKRVAN